MSVWTAIIVAAITQLTIIAAGIAAQVVVWRTRRTFTNSETQTNVSQSDLNRQDLEAKLRGLIDNLDAKIAAMKLEQSAAMATAMESFTERERVLDAKVQAMKVESEIRATAYAAALGERDKEIAKLVIENTRLKEQIIDITQRMSGLYSSLEQWQLAAKERGTPPPQDTAIPMPEPPKEAVP